MEYTKIVDATSFRAMFTPKEKQLMYAAMAENRENEVPGREKGRFHRLFLQGKDATIAAAANLYECIVLPCTWADVDATCKHEGKTALMHAGHMGI